MSPSALVAQAARLVPSWRSLLVGFALLGMAAAAYVLARETSVFALRTIEVEGAPPRVAEEVREALAPLAGTSLLKLTRGDVDRQLARLPTVAAASHDRAFPHTLKVFVRAEHPLAVLRRGADAWLVSASGRIMRELRRPGLSSLPRIWIPRSSSIANGAALADEQGIRGVRALAELRSIPIQARVRDVVSADGELTLLLSSGLEVRLGNASNLRLKLAVARRVLPELTPPGYLDLSVPERAVARTNSQPEG